MNKKIHLLFLICIAILITGVMCVLFQPPRYDAIAHVSMLDVGQGDSFLIQAANGTQVLIDGGKDASVLTELAKVMPRGDRSIDVVIATHPDADHIGGLPLVLSRYNVGLFLTTQAASDSEVFKTLFGVIEKKDIPAYFARRGMTLFLKGNNSFFTVLFPDRTTSQWETNTASIVGRLQIGTVSMLFTGDSPSSIEHFLTRADAKNINVDILKLGHHGSKTSSSEEYLRATSPSLALISDGINNRYGHPAPEIVARLKALGIPSISTQDKGTVIIDTDGVTWSVAP